VHDSDCYAGVLAHSQTSKKNNREVELSLENKGHNIIAYYCIVLIFNILLLFTYAASIAPCWLHTPILPALLHLRPTECLFFYIAIKDWHGHHSYLLQATKVNLLAHAKSVTPAAPSFPWSSKSGSEVTTNDTEKIYRIGKPRGKEDPVRGLPHAEREFSSVGHVLLAFESRGRAARLLKFAHPPNLWGISLTDYTCRSPVVQAGFRQQRHYPQVLDCSHHDTIWP